MFLNKIRYTCPCCKGTWEQDVSMTRYFECPGCTQAFILIGIKEHELFPIKNTTVDFKVVEEE
jgi:hypothetical protein